MPYCLQKRASPPCLQTSSVRSPGASLQWLGFYRHPLGCHRDQRSRGDHSCHRVSDAPAARAAPRWRHVRGHGQRRGQEGRHCHSEGQSSGETTRRCRTQAHLHQVKSAGTLSLLPLSEVRLCWRIFHTSSCPDTRVPKTLTASCQT